VADPAPDLRTLAPDVPDRVARVVARCLAKDPAARFADATELAEALARPERASASTWLALGAAGIFATLAGGYALRAPETPRPDVAAVASAPAAPTSSPPPPLAPPTETVETSSAVQPPVASASARRPIPSAAPKRPSSAPSASASRFDVPGLSETQK
jgi:serine/threonine-protein kinase